MSIELWMVILLTGLAVGTAGLTGYVIFGPLTWRHLLDREQQQGKGSWFLSPRFMRYVLLRRWADSTDPNLRGLAAPAMVLGWCMIVGGIISGFALFFAPGAFGW